MPRKPEYLTLKNLIPTFYGPNGLCVHWYLCLPQGPRVYVGEGEHDVTANLRVLNQLAVLCQNRWRGVASITISTLGD